jgi:radical SAM protein with 4Fe4S-binding SPASM domain
MNHQAPNSTPVTAKPRDRYRMDDHKLTWHLDRVAAWQRGERIAPLHIDMGITTGCNMACSYCYGVLQNREGYGTDFKGKFNMPREAIERTFSDAKKIGVRSIAIIGEGENTLNPDLYNVVDHGRRIDLDLSLATNGIRIDKERINTLLQGLTWLRVNISAATHESFEQIHKSPHFERVLGNIGAIVKEKQRLGSNCTIGMQMVVTKQNFDDIVPLARIGRDLGVDYFVVKQCSDTYDGVLDAPLKEYADITDVLREAEAMTDDKYTVSIKWEKIGNGGWKDYDVCFGTQFIIAISGNGSIFPCGHWFAIEREKYLMGNVIETPLAEIVASERYWEVQKLIQKVNVNRDCETNCRQHYINRFLSRTATEPEHVNFV